MSVIDQFAKLTLKFCQFLFVERGIQVQHNTEHPQHSAEHHHLRRYAGRQPALCPHGRRPTQAQSGRLCPLCHLHRATICAAQLVRHLLQVSYAFS